MINAHPRISRRYSIGARRLNPRRPGSVVSDVDTPVRMQSSITPQIFMIWEGVSMIRGHMVSAILWCGCRRLYSQRISCKKCERTKVTEIELSHFIVMNDLRNRHLATWLASSVQTERCS